jgi:hypothetical protein
VSGTAIVAALAVVQAVAEFLLSAPSIRTGAAEIGRGALFLPLVGGALLARGGFAIGLGVLYAVFAWALFTGRRWAWLTGVIAVVLSAFAVMVLIAASEDPAQIALRAIIPLIVLGYLVWGSAGGPGRPGGTVALCG